MKKKNKEFRQKIVFEAIKKKKTEEMIATKETVFILSNLKS